MSTNTLTILAIILIALIIVVFLIVRIAKRVKRGSSHDDAYENEQIYIGNLAYRVNEDDLRDYFSQFGSIKYAKVVKNHKTGRSKGFAFVTYGNTREANKALQAHGEDLRGRTMVVRIAKPR